MDADDLLSGPRGRRACSEYVALRDGGRATSADEAVADACSHAMYWQEPWSDDLDLASNPERLRPAAEALAADPLTTWWDDPVVPGDQWARGIALWGADETPARGTRAAAIEEEDAVAQSRRRQRDEAWHDWRITSGTWWSHPAATLVTTRALPASGMAASIAWIEDAPTFDTALAWPVTIRSERPVYEVYDAGSWVELVRRYPMDVTTPARRGDWWRTTGRDGAWALPDWPAVMRDFDGVHVTVGAYLSSAGRALDVDGVLGTVLAGWEPDATYWFTDRVDVGAEPVRWTCADDESWHREALC